MNIYIGLNVVYVTSCSHVLFSHEKIYSMTLTVFKLWICHLHMTLMHIAIPQIQDISSLLNLAWPVWPILLTLISRLSTSPCQKIPRCHFDKTKKNYGTNVFWSWYWKCLFTGSQSWLMFWCLALSKSSMCLNIMQSTAKYFFSFRLMERLAHVLCVFSVFVIFFTERSSCCWTYKKCRIFSNMNYMELNFNTIYNNIYFYHKLWSQ